MDATCRRLPLSAVTIPKCYATWNALVQFLAPLPPPQRHAAGQGLPRSFLQADLDFVLPGEHSVAELLLGDAEVGRWEAE